MSLVRIALLCSLIAGGCATDQLDLAATEQAVKPQPGDDEGCPPWACGSNSPQIDFNMFHELNEYNRYNAEGFRIIALQKFVNGSWVNYRADVTNASLNARSLVNDAIVYSGVALEGARFVLFNNLTGLTYYLTINEIGRINLWAKINGTTRVTLTYRMTWSTSPNPSAGVVYNLCGANTDGDGVPDFFAVMFEDDRIDADAIRVTGETAYWFNIGCAGHALAKQHLTGNTRAAAAILGASPPTINQRTANLKMISGDYCGGGDPFTVAGQPLRWKDSLGRFNTTNPLDPQLQNIEARWNETGAVCLNTPRVDYHLTPLGTQTFPNGVESLLPITMGWCTGANGSHVRPPPCSPNQGDFQGAYLISVNK